MILKGKDDPYKRGAICQQKERILLIILYKSCNKLDKN